MTTLFPLVDALCDTTALFTLIHHGGFPERKANAA